MSDDIFFNLGAKIAAVNLNRNSEDLTTIASFVSTVDNVKEANYGALQKFVCKVAADSFAALGQQNELEYHIYEKLASTPVWYPELDMFSDAVFASLGKVATEHHESEKNIMNDALVKSSSIKEKLMGLIQPVLGALKSTAEVTPQIIQGVALAGAAGGSALGSLYWLLNSHASEDEADAEVLKAKIDYYNKVNNEIKKQLGTRSLPPAQLAQKVEDVMQNENLF